MFIQTSSLQTQNPTTKCTINSNEVNTTIRDIKERELQRMFMVRCMNLVQTRRLKLALRMDLSVHSQRSSVTTWSTYYNNIRMHGNLGDTSVESPHANGAVNFASILNYSSSVDFNKLSCGCFKAKTNLWILDSRATHHINFEKNHLAKIITMPYPILVRLSNKESR